MQLPKTVLITAALIFCAAVVIIAAGISDKENKAQPVAESIIDEQPVNIKNKTAVIKKSPIASVTKETVPETEPPLPEYVRVGDKHPKIMGIQQRLMDLGFMDSDEPTDYYGNATEAAVIKFQRQCKLNQDGILGPETMEKIMADDAPHYAVGKGDKGDDIAMIQQRLYQLGYLAEDDYITGNFGDKTEEAVKKLQEINAITVDGKVGMQTVNLIYSDEVKANFLVFGEKSEIVLKAQQRLYDLGYMTSIPDGEYGNDTSNAIKTFQQKNALIVDGYLGPETREVLMSGSALHNGLGLGDENETVKRVQQLLEKWGYLSNGKDTGYFGEMTLSAVKNFQSRNGLSVDGMVGAQTMRALTSDDAKRAAADTGTSSSQQSLQNTDNGSSKEPEPVTSGVSSAVDSLLSVARSKMGCPYVYGAKGPDRFDCSGFVYWCLNQVGVNQSYITSYGWRSVGKYNKISNYSNLRAGDIIVVSGHVGIISTDGYVIDASSSNGCVIERKLSNWWSNHFICGWRIF